MRDVGFSKFLFFKTNYLKISSDEKITEVSNKKRFSSKRLMITYLKPTLFDNKVMSNKAQCGYIFLLEAKVSHAIGGN